MRWNRSDSRVCAEIGLPDILINNAGSGRWAYLDECSYDEIDEIVAAPSTLRSTSRARFFLRCWSEEVA